MPSRVGIIRRGANGLHDLVDIEETRVGPLVIVDDVTVDWCRGDPHRSVCSGIYLSDLAQKFGVERSVHSSACVEPNIESGDRAGLLRGPALSPHLLMDFIQHSLW